MNAHSLYDRMNSPKSFIHAIGRQYEALSFIDTLPLESMNSQIRDAYMALFDVPPESMCQIRFSHHEAPSFNDTDPAFLDAIVQCQLRRDYISTGWYDHNKPVDTASWRRLLESIPSHERLSFELTSVYPAKRTEFLLEIVRAVNNGTLSISRDHGVSWIWFLQRAMGIVHPLTAIDDGSDSESGSDSDSDSGEDDNGGEGPSDSPARALEKSQRCTECVRKKKKCSRPDGDKECDQCRKSRQPKDGKAKPACVLEPLRASGIYGRDKANEKKREPKPKKE
ncbi:hypothetical protein BDZ45DRAFT_697331 [Acephala macrosclerotiorum]|nr:hypothetical protein BDZ45DRAFT_697331 [Acephala macrosclerotiorum]